MRQFLRIRLINLGNNKKLAKQISDAFEDWGYKVFSNSGPGSEDCDTIITIGHPADPEPSVSVKINGTKVTIRCGKNESIPDFVVKIVSALTDQFVASHHKGGP